MTAGNCRSATTMYEYENRNSELRQSMQHETATEHLIEQGKPHRTIVRAALLQSRLHIMLNVSEQPCYRADCNVCVLLILRAYM